MLVSCLATALPSVAPGRDSVGQSPRAAGSGPVLNHHEGCPMWSAPQLLKCDARPSALPIRMAGSVHIFARQWMGAHIIAHVVLVMF